MPLPYTFRRASSFWMPDQVRHDGYGPDALLTVWAAPLPLGIHDALALYVPARLQSLDAGSSPA